MHLTSLSTWHVSIVCTGQGLSHDDNEGRIWVITRAFIIFRAMRGEGGITWSAQELLTSKAAEQLATAPDMNLNALQRLFCTAAIYRRIARMLLIAHDKRSCSKPSWASHCEGRHVMYSGRYALEALASGEGSLGCARIEVKLSQLVRKAMQSPSATGGQSPVSRGPWTDGDTATVLEIWKGNLPLRVQDGKVMFAGSYNSQNAGIGWLSWATSATALPVVHVRGAAFESLWEGQSATSKAYLRQSGRHSLVVK